MDLNAHKSFNQIDQDGMYQSIIELPDQLQKSYSGIDSFPITGNKSIRNVVLAGMGGSAIAGDLIKTCYVDDLNVPFHIHRDYFLPAWVKGQNCLVILSSHSGNTEETISAFECAIERNCNTLVISTGGKLCSLADKNNTPAWKFLHSGQPRSAVGCTFGMLSRLFEGYCFIPEQKDNINRAILEMKDCLEKNNAEIPTAKNPAKRLAGQLIDQFVTIFAAEHLSSVARRWKTQINELAKCSCQFENLPEADHNTLAGIFNPDCLLSKSFSVFLQSHHYNLRNRTRMDLTFTEYMVAGIGTDLMTVRGESKVSEMWQAILFGDLMAFYLAMLYDTDPTQIDAIESLKMQLP